MNLNATMAPGHTDIWNSTFGYCMQLQHQEITTISVPSAPALSF